MIAGDPAYVVWGFWFMFAMLCIVVAGIALVVAFALLGGADTPGDRP